MEIQETETAATRDRVEQRTWDVVRFVNSVDHTTVREVAEECGIPRNQAKVYLHRAARQGWISHQIHGVYGPVEASNPGVNP